MTRHFVFLGLGVWAGAAVAADDYTIFTRAESFSFSNSVPAKSYLEQLIGPGPEGGGNALSRNLIEAGFGWNNLEFSIFHRNDYNLDFHPETAVFAWRNKNEQTLENGDLYRVDVEANQYQLSGGKLGYNWQITPEVTVYAAISAFVATEGIYGSMGPDPEGQGGTVGFALRDRFGTDQRYLAGDIYADYFYTRDILFERDIDAPTGRGYSLDLAGSWQVTDDFRLLGRVDDLSGKIFWDDMPRTIARATSENFTLNDAGFVEAHPSFDGREFYDDVEQPLRRRVRLKGEYTLYNNWIVDYEYDRMEVVDFHRLGVGYNFSPYWGVHGSVEVDSQAIQLDLLMPLGRLTLALDDVDVDNVRTFGFGWSLTVPLGR